MPTSRERQQFPKTWISLFIFIGLFNLGLIGLVVYVAWHFIAKFW